jgi:hypothetical protein
MAPITDAPDDLNFAGRRGLHRRSLLGGMDLRSMVLLSSFPCLNVPWVLPLSRDGAKNMLLVASSYCVPRFAVRMI